MLTSTPPHIRCKIFLEAWFVAVTLNFELWPNWSSLSSQCSLLNQNKYPGHTLQTHVEALTKLSQHSTFVLITFHLVIGDSPILQSKQPKRLVRAPGHEVLWLVKWHWVNSSYCKGMQKVFERHSKNVSRNHQIEIFHTGSLEWGDSQVAIIPFSLCCLRMGVFTNPLQLYIFTAHGAPNYHYHPNRKPTSFSNHTFIFWVNCLFIPKAEHGWILLASYHHLDSFFGWSLGGKAAAFFCSETMSLNSQVWPQLAGVKLKTQPSQNLTKLHLVSVVRVPSSKGIQDVQAFLGAKHRNPPIFTTKGSKAWLLGESWRTFPQSESLKKGFN